jgi:hypothetical protein
MNFYLLHLSKIERGKCISKLEFVKQFGIKMLHHILTHLLQNHVVVCFQKHWFAWPWKPRFNYCYQHIPYIYANIQIVNMYLYVSYVIVDM